MSKIVKPDLTYQWASAAGGGSVAPSSSKIQTGHIVEKPNYEYMNWLQNRQDKSIAYTFQMGVPEWDALVEYQYHANYKSYVQRNGLVYKALQVGTNKDPATEAAYWALAFDNSSSAATVQTNLNTHITNYGTLASLSNVATARTNLDVFSKGESNTNFAALAGLSSQVFSAADGTTTYQVVNKGQLDTKADLAGLYTQVFSAANGTTAYQVVNKSQLDTKAALAGSSGQLFSAANGTTGYEVVNKSQLDTKAPVAGNSGQEFAVATATTGNSAVNKTQFDAKTGIATDTVSGIVEKATQAETNNGTTDKFPDAALIKAATFTPKAFVVFTADASTATIDSSYNVATVVRNSTGQYTVTFSNTLPSTPCVSVDVIDTSTTGGYGGSAIAYKIARCKTASTTTLTITVRSISVDGNGVGTVSYADTNTVSITVL